MVAPEPVAAALRLWILDVEDGAQRGRTPKPKDAAPEAEPEPINCRLLLRSEARAQLKGWASAHCWQSARDPSARANWRALGQGLPHRDAFAPSRTARRLAEWAWGLPKTWPTSEAETSATLQDILTDQSLGGALALAVLDADDEASAIVCVEGVGGIERLRVVGAVANPLAPESQSLCEDAVREVQAIASR
ncbi:unnamed protein product [Effrenium voratum]|uniref:Uncharacterized protein n=1 Tax=Effrenium voratum TaxID=2562239 RepID=A0AA36MZP6_9DINO|nr:unnamed protein product [Effrenium voratum]CAJ1431639.1 unnamed protein product [Effrenium voratum]